MPVILQVPAVAGVEAHSANKRGETRIPAQTVKYRGHIHEREARIALLERLIQILKRAVVIEIQMGAGQKIGRDITAFGALGKLRPQPRGFADIAGNIVRMRQ